MRNKREKFVELAENRVTKALKAITLIGNLANKANYEYSEEDFQKIFRAVDGSVREMKKRFTDSGAGNRKTFTLSED
jgi:hypothetical protein